MATTLTMTGGTLAAVLGCDADQDLLRWFEIDVDGDDVRCYRLRLGVREDVGPEWTPTRQQLVDAGEIEP